MNGLIEEPANTNKSRAINRKVIARGISQYFFFEKRNFNSDFICFNISIIF